ncbi:MAG: alpha/beta hydrolase [Cellvibrionaceae bacterium]
MLKSSDLKQIQDVLRPLAFNIQEDEKHTRSPAFQKYLNHYQINFARTMKNVRHGFGTFKVGEFTVAAHYWLPDMPRGTIFVFHGYFDHVGLFNHLIRFSLQNDYAVVAYDLPGMGLSNGERATTDSFDNYYRVMTACCEHFRGLAPEKWYAVAQSAGSTALLKHILSKGLAPFSKVVVLAPLVRSRGWSRDRWLYALGRLFIRSLPRVFSENSHDEAFLEFVKKSDPLQTRHLPVKWVGAMKNWIDDFGRFSPQPHPVYVIQGDNDNTVDWKYNIDQIKAKLPNAQVKIVHRGRHHLVAESAPYRAQVFASIKAYLEKKEGD